MPVPDGVESKAELRLGRGPPSGHEFPVGWGQRVEIVELRKGCWKRQQLRALS